MKVEIFSDIVCPWCYIGERRFERALMAYEGRNEVEVSFRPYQLDASAPSSAVPIREYLDRRFGRSSEAMLERVSKVAEQEGIAIDWDRALSANTRAAHELVGLAEREYGPEVQRTLMNALFAAHFTHGGDISDLEQLTDLATEVGLDRKRVQEYLTSGEGTQALLADLGHALELGITAVPTFIFEGQYIVQGGQPASVFLQVLEEVARRIAVTADEPTDERCSDGSCVA